MHVSENLTSHVFLIKPGGLCSALLLTPVHGYAAVLQQVRAGRIAFLYICPQALCAAELGLASLMSGDSS